jgi:hypothetical protein
MASYRTGERVVGPRRRVVAGSPSEYFGSKGFLSLPIEPGSKNSDKVPNGERPVEARDRPARQTAEQRLGWGLPQINLEIRCRRPVLLPHQIERPTELTLDAKSQTNVWLKQSVDYR